MKRIIKRFFTVAVLAAAINTVAFGYNMPEKIRVGIEYKCKEVSSISIGNKEIEIGIENNGTFYKEAEVSAKNSFAFVLESGKSVDANEFYGTYKQALSGCEDIKKMWGYNAVPAYVKKGLWGIYVSNLSSSEAASAESNLSGKIVNSSELMLLYDGDKTVMAFDGVRPQVMPIDSDVIKIWDRSYRGAVEFGRYTKANITAVNIIDIEEYLYGVVPSEMPSSWHVEALKAQSVAARSYTLTRMGVHSDAGYDVCDGTHCQVYIGKTQEMQSTNKAVNDTRGIVGYHKGNPINALFFSSSGGSTDNSENVWTNTIPYLKAVPEINETGGLSWTRTYTSDEIKNILADKGIDVGTVKNIEITQIGEYGRVQEVTITGSKSTKVLKKEETRTIFSQTKEGSLASRMYTINGKGGMITGNSQTNSKGDGTVYVYAKNGSSKSKVSETYVISEEGKKSDLKSHNAMYGISKGGEVLKVNLGEGQVINASNQLPLSGETADVFVFDGKGLGHGVGMSQYGAKGMAEKGYTYEEILKYYYKDITVE